MIRIVLMLLVAVVGAAPVGCGSRSIKPGFASVDPQERTAALVEAARADRAERIPELISLLESSDPAERMLAAQTLRRLTGGEFGYRHFDPEWRRREAVQRWRSWWEQERESYAENPPEDEQNGRRAS